MADEYELGKVATAAEAAFYGLALGDIDGVRASVSVSWTTASGRELRFTIEDAPEHDVDEDDEPEDADS